LIQLSNLKSQELLSFGWIGPRWDLLSFWEKMQAKESILPVTPLIDIFLQKLLEKK